MPWSKDRLPSAAKNLTDKQKEIFVAVANSVLKDTGDEGRAIASGLAAAKKEKDKVTKSVEIEKAEKKEADGMHSASDYAYVPDPEKPSTWKLRIDDSTHVSAATAALGKGFRGNKVQIPSEDLPAVKRKVKAAYKKFFPDSEVPDILKSVEFTDKLALLIEKFFGGSEQEVEAVEQITKSVNEEQRLALFVVLEPQDGEETTDLHGDTYTVEEVEKACHNFNQHCMKANLFHKVETEEVKIVESYVALVDFVLDDKTIKKGTWLQSWYFPETEVGEILWKSVKDGTIDGVSIQGRATTESLDD